MMSYAPYVFTFLGGMVFGVFSLAWLIMKIYKARKGQ